MDRHVSGCLLLSVIILLTGGCITNGNDTSDSDFNPAAQSSDVTFSMAPFKKRSVSNESMSGTWIMRTNLVLTQGEFQVTMVAITLFILEPEEQLSNLYRSSLNCKGGFTHMLSSNGVFSGDDGNYLINNNVILTGRNIPQEGVLFTYEGYKISDSNDYFGDLVLNDARASGSEAFNITCFSQKNYSSWKHGVKLDGDFEVYSVGRENDGYISYDNKSNDSKINIDQFYAHKYYAEEDGDTMNFNLSESTDTRVLANFYATDVDTGNGFTGSIKILIP